MQRGSSTGRSWHVISEDPVWIVPPPTPYPDVNALLHDVLIGAQQRLGPHFVGMYLEGSLVSDDFDQDSDIDFVVVTSDDLSPEQFTAVQLMHDHIATTPSWYADQLEGFYVAQRALRRYDPAHASHANLERGPGERLKREQLGSWWWVHLAILRERGVTLAGPSPHTLIDPIAPQVLQRTVADTVDEWALPKLHQPELLRTRGSQAYVVLTLCRMLYTLATGRIVTQARCSELGAGHLGGAVVAIDRGRLGRTAQPSRRNGGERGVEAVDRAHLGRLLHRSRVAGGSARDLGIYAVHD